MKYKVDKLDVAISVMVVGVIVQLFWLVSVFKAAWQVFKLGMGI